MRPLTASPIIRRILSHFVLGGAAIFLLVSLTTLQIVYHSRLNQAESDLAQLIKVMELPYARALWNYDTAQLEAVSKSVAATPNVFKVEVLDERDAQLVAVSKPGTNPAIEKVVIRTVFAENQQNPIGSLRIHVSFQPIRAEFWRNAGGLVLAEFVRIVALSALLLLILHRNLIAPLVDMARRVVDIDPNSASPPLSLRRAPHRKDEIDQLAEAINAFHGQIIDERNARRQMEEQSRSLANELARMSRVATVESLTTTIAHELNQPLGAILSNAETIELSTLEKLAHDDPLREILADIISETRRAGDIVRNLRKLTEKRDVEATRLTLNPLLIEVVNLMRLDVRWEAIRLEVDLQDDLPPVIGNAVQLQQVIMNLVANARDAIHESAIAAGIITIKTERVDERWLRVAVSDNGPGITAEKLDYIFNPFYTTKEGGTGMGLWIAQMIIEQHGGKLDFTRTPQGCGTCFYFTLPVSLQP